MPFKNMAVQVNSYTALDVLDELTEPPLFNVNTRFSDQAIYVDLDHSYAATRFRVMAAALSYKDRQNEVKLGISTSIPAVETKLLSNLNDAILTFSCACNELCMSHDGYDIEDQYIFGIYNRSSF